MIEIDTTTLTERGNREVTIERTGEITLPLNGIERPAIEQEVEAEKTKEDIPVLVLGIKRKR